MTDYSLSTPLLNTQEMVERTIFHSIRKQFVARDFTPDISTFAKTSAGYQAYLNALAAIRTAKGYAIEVFNSGPPDDMELKQIPRVVLDTQGFMPGSVGGDQSQIYTEDNTGKYYSEIAPPTTCTMYFNIHILAANSIQERIINAIIALAVPRRGYMEIFKTVPDGKKDWIFVNFLSYVPVREFNSPGTMETVARYVCPDLVEINNITTAVNISPLKEFTVDIESDEAKLAYFYTSSNSDSS